MCFGAATCNQTSLTLPVDQYTHAGGNCAVTGGFVYRGTRIPCLAGYYLYADFCSRRVWAFIYDGGAIRNKTELTVDLDSATLIPARRGSRRSAWTTPASCCVISPGRSIASILNKGLRRVLVGAAVADRGQGTRLAVDVVRGRHPRRNLADARRAGRQVIGRGIDVQVGRSAAGRKHARGDGSALTGDD